MLKLMVKIIPKIDFDKLKTGKDLLGDFEVKQSAININFDKNRFIIFFLIVDVILVKLKVLC